MFNISDLIEKLREVRKKHGDLPVLHRCMDELNPEGMDVFEELDPYQYLNIETREYPDKWKDCPDVMDKCDIKKALVIWRRV